jgi:phosphoglycerate dehydrogenase-like enzyme
LSKPKVAILVPDVWVNKVICPKDRERMEKIFDLQARDFQSGDIPAQKELLAGADACISGWGTNQLTEDTLDAAPHLKIIAHAAGSVKPIISDAVWDRSIAVTSSAPAIAIGVAEHTLGLMLSAMKRSYWFNTIAHNGGWRDEGQLGRIVEMFGITIGVAGAGYVGRHLIKLLHNFDVDILLYDPFVSDEDAGRLGVTKAETMEDLMSRADILSLNAPSLPSTHHMVNAGNLKLLKDGALLINTARGTLIDEVALYEELKTGRITACLDVTDPEPPAVDNPLRGLENVVLTPHIAGAAANNLFRLGNLAMREVELFFAGKSALYPVTKEDLSRIA